jgi:hypothetical protein
MMRVTLENLVRDERLDQIFTDAAERQYQKQILFSQMVTLMSAVATREHASVHASYLALQDELGVSVAAVYDKLQCLEPGISSAMVREIGADAAKVIDNMPGALRSIIPGLKLYFLDGNHFAATEHRLKVLRTTREGALPGHALALLDAQREVVLEVIPCEDAYTQERALLAQLLPRITAGMVIVADRNFCTTNFLFGLRNRNAFFIIRQHASTLTWRLVGRRRRIGRVETGTVYEQEIVLEDCRRGKVYDTMHARRITVVLDHPTESGDEEIHVITNLTEAQADAKAVAMAYRERWTIEGMFQNLTDVLRCEVETLGYPKAAVFSFAIAVLSWNIYAVVKAALRAVHGEEVIDETLSDHHLTRHIVAMQPGMDIALEPEDWECYQFLTPKQLARELLRLAALVDLRRYPKKKRGPKKPPPKKKSGKRNHHISTARILAESKPQAP